jgi:16S rRNA (cytosine967-C5)-methyltransferase
VSEADARGASGGPPAPSLAEVLTLSARVWRDVADGHALDRALATHTPAGTRLRAAVQDVSYAAVRRRALAGAVIARLAARPPAAEVTALLAVALPQLVASRHAAHTVVDQAVSAARAQPETAAAAGFVNALLRNFGRQKAALVAEADRDETVRCNAPRAWIDAVRRAHPADADRILERSLEAPPLVLRVNRRRSDVARALAAFGAAGLAATRVGREAVWLHAPRPVAQIPGFPAGEVSVQDAGAQLAAQWLDAAAGQRVLDACAAPGGKTAHLAELADLDLTALEVDAARARRIDENLTRLGLAADVRVGDARTPERWWNGVPYDRILLDAPCTASGIVRRHPDIPWLRRPDDVAQLATLQGQLLDALWPLVGSGGRLLYVVCSVFPEEGSAVIARFLERHADAVRRPLPGGAAERLLLPSAATATAWDETMSLPTLHDGFFYAALEKPR